MRRSNSELIAAKNAEYGRELDTRKATFEIEKIKAEVSAKAMQERANEDVAIRKLQVARCSVFIGL